MTAALRSVATRFGGQGRESATSIVAGLVVYALGLLTGPLLARALGPEGRGELSSVVVPAQLYVWLVAFGLPAGVAYHRSRRNEGELFGALALSTIAVGGPVTAVLVAVVPQYLADRDPVTVLWLRLALVEALLGLLFLGVTEMVRSRTAGVTYNVLFSSPILLNFVVVVGLFASGSLTLEWALAAFVGTSFLAHLTVVARWRPLPVRWPGRALLASVWSYGIRAWVGTFSNVLISRFDQLLLVSLVPARDLGLYVVAVSAVSVSVPIGVGTRAAILPQVKRDPLGQRATQRRALLIVTLGSITVASLVALAAPVVVPALFGADFAGAVPLIWILLPGQVCYDIGMVQAAYLGATGRPGRGSAAVLTSAAVTVVALPVAVSIHGTAGAAAVSSASYAVLLVVVTILGRRTGARTSEASG